MRAPLHAVGLHAAELRAHGEIGLSPKRDASARSPRKGMLVLGKMDGGFPSKLTIILGAGASHDCAANQTQVNRHWHPPLAKEVFAPRFEAILSHYPKVQARLDEIRTRLDQGENIEGILRDLYYAADRTRNYWVLGIPLYLRELFWTISLDYLRGSSKFDTLVRYALDSPFENILFLNLNYDLFLESALERYGNHEFDSLSSYLPDGKKWLLVKPHGSVNWARILENCPTDSTGRPLPSLLQGPAIFSPELRVVMWNRHLHDFYSPGGGPPGYLYPQIVVPANGPKGFVCPGDHTDRAKAFIKNCQNFLLIGFSARDDDVLDLLHSMPGRSRVMIVSGKDARAIFKRVSSHVPSLKAKKLVVSFYSAGFSRFVESERFRTSILPPPE
jgi:hypothetical protein